MKHSSNSSPFLFFFFSFIFHLRAAGCYRARALKNPTGWHFCRGGGWGLPWSHCLEHTRKPKPVCRSAPSMGGGRRCSSEAWVGTIPDQPSCPGEGEAMSGSKMAFPGLLSPGSSAARFASSHTNVLTELHLFQGFSIFVLTHDS